MRTHSEPPAASYLSPDLRPDCVDLDHEEHHSDREYSINQKEYPAVIDAIAASQTGSGYITASGRSSADANYYVIDKSTIQGSLESPTLFGHPLTLCIGSGSSYLGSPLYSLG